MLRDTRAIMLPDGSIQVYAPEMAARLKARDEWEAQRRRYLLYCPDFVDEEPECCQSCHEDSDEGYPMGGPISYPGKLKVDAEWCCGVSRAKGDVVLTRDDWAASLRRYRKRHARW